MESNTNYMDQFIWTRATFHIHNISKMVNIFSDKGGQSEVQNDPWGEILCRFSPGPTFLVKLLHN